MPRAKKPTPTELRLPAELPLELPAHVKLTDKEMSVVARLIRVRRQQKYWLRYYIEHLLHMDAAGGSDITVKQAFDALKVMENFDNWQQFFSRQLDTWCVLAEFPGLEWYPWDKGDYSDEAQLGDITEQSLNRKEQLEAELRELRTLITSPRASFRPQAAEYAQRLGKALDRMAKEDQQIDKNCGDDK